MRAPKVRSYGAQPPVRAPKARLYGTHPSLHDRAGTLASPRYKAEKPSVHPQFFGRVDLRRGYKDQHQT